MDKESKRKEIQKVSMRKLLASVKLDIRKTMKNSQNPPKTLKNK